MGCISSKLMPKSKSLKGELNQSMQRSANGIPALEESVINSQSINEHQFLALVYTANTVSSKLRSPAVVDHNISLTSNTREQGEDRARSRSCWLSEHELSSHIPDTSDDRSEDEESDHHNGVGRARSFHTVDEYDAIIDKLMFSGAHQRVSNVKYDDSRTKMQLSLLADETLEENSKIDATSELEHIANPNICIANKEVKLVQDSSPQENNILEKGHKRKSIAKRLESLEIPDNVEFSGVASLRGWLNSCGQVYSPGAYYATPKLGNYTQPYSPNACNEGAIFNPELVAAFEEPMQ